MVSIVIPIKRFFVDLTSERDAKKFLYIQQDTQMFKPSLVIIVTFAVLAEWITEEASNPVRGNGKWDSCGNLQGVDADYLAILNNRCIGQIK